jgi:hypothetical protein
MSENNVNAGNIISGRISPFITPEYNMNTITDTMTGPAIMMLVFAAATLAVFVA